MAVGISNNIIGSMKEQMLVFLDLETTGLSHKYHRIVEIGMIKVKNQKIIDTFDELVNPGMEIPYGATAVHGIEDCHVINKPRIKKHKKNIKEFIGDSIIVTHNGKTFDRHFLHNELKEVIIEEHRHIDFLPLSRRVDCACVGGHSLPAIAKRYRIQIRNSHRALGDTKILYKCFFKLLSKHEINSLQEVFKILGK